MYIVLNGALLTSENVTNLREILLDGSRENVLNALIFHSLDREFDTSTHECMGCGKTHGNAVALQIRQETAVIVQFVAEHFQHVEANPLCKEIISEMLIEVMQEMKIDHEVQLLWRTHLANLVPDAFRENLERRMVEIEELRAGMGIELLFLSLLVNDAAVLIRHRR